ncbi:MAG: hypothetical protein HY298_01340 [Verrucomicrobia bacterium]|nr:hypothetical protein [Verrucomicrobiota bacterium]
MKSKSILAMISLATLLEIGFGLGAQGQVQQLTTNATSETWGIRHSTTSRGKMLWVDADGTVVLYDGAITNALQLKGILGSVDDIVFALGSGSAPGSVIAVWRRGTDSGWVSLDGAAPVSVTATNPIDVNQPLNAEGVAVGDGSIFMVLQAFASAQTVKHVFRVDPASGFATNLTGNAPVPGAEGRLSTGNGQAAWPFFDNTNGIAKLHFYDRAFLRVIDTNIVGNPHLAQGRVVYVKAVGGVNQIFLYDSTQTNPAPVQLTSDGTGTNSFPRTDGFHLAWLRNGAGATNQEIILYGGLALTTPDTLVSNQLAEFREQPFQLQYGQLLWKDINGRLLYAVDGHPAPAPLSPAATFGGNNCCRAWLGDGYIGWIGLSEDGGADSEVFRSTGTPPQTGFQLSAPLVVIATPGIGQATVQWDNVLGATSYNVYMAPDPRLTKDNYPSMPGGRRFPDVTSPFIVTGLTNHAYFFVVTAVFGDVESPGSTQAAAMLWNTVGGLTNAALYSVTTGFTNGPVAYAAGKTNVYKSSDSGNNWNSLAGGIAGLDVRAVAADGPRVYAATRDFFGGSPSQIWQSTNAGSSWLAIVPDGGAIGELNKSLVIDPVVPSTAYAGDFRLPTMVEPDDSFLIKSTNSGASWFHLPDPTDPLGAEIRAYAIAINPSNHTTLYVGGSGTPNLVKSTDGGTTWTNVSPGPGFVYAVGIDPFQTATIYAGGVDFSQVSPGIHKSTNAGATWTLKNSGLPVPLPQVRSMLVDPIAPGYIHLGTDAGYYFSSDGGEHWIAGSGGLDSSQARYIYALSLTETRRLIAATAGGLYLLDISPFNLVAPNLQVTRLGSDVVLSWSVTASDFILEMTGELSNSSVWTVVTNVPSTSNGIMTVTNSTLGAKKFYRLRKP